MLAFIPKHAVLHFFHFLKQISITQKKKKKKDFISVQVAFCDWLLQEWNDRKNRRNDKEQMVPWEKKQWQTKVRIKKRTLIFLTSEQQISRMQKLGVHIFFFWWQAPRSTCEQILAAALGSGWAGGAGGFAETFDRLNFPSCTHVLVKDVWLYAQQRTKTGGPRIWLAEGS